MIGLETKVLLTGILLLTAWLIPGLFNNVNPPNWFKAIVVITGLIGLLMTIFGLLWTLWK